MCVQVGSEVARRGKGLGFATVVAYDPYASEAKALALGVELVSFDKALAMGDFFSLHMPLTPDTKVCLVAAVQAENCRQRVAHAGWPLLRAGQGPASSGEHGMGSHTAL